MSKKEIGHNDLPFQAIPGNGFSFLVGKFKIAYLVPDRIGHSFSLLCDHHYGVGQVMGGHMDGIIRFLLKHKKESQWKNQGHKYC